MQREDLFDDFPVFDAAGVGREADTDLEEFSWVGREWFCISFVFDLLQCCVGGVVDLQLYDIYIFLSLEKKVYASVAGASLCLNIFAEEFHYDVMGDCTEEKNYILFDYVNRSKLTHQASVFSI